MLITRNVTSSAFTLKDTLGNYTSFSITVPTVTGYTPIALCEQWFENHLVDYVVPYITLSGYTIIGYVTANRNVGNNYSDTKVCVKVLYLKNI